VKDTQRESRVRFCGVASPPSGPGAAAAGAAGGPRAPAAWWVAPRWARKVLSESRPGTGMVGDRGGGDSSGSSGSSGGGGGEGGECGGSSGAAIAAGRKERGLGRRSRLGSAASAVEDVAAPKSSGIGEPLLPFNTQI
jgi:hypothetical protein